MRRLILGVALVASACGGTTEPNPKARALDPYITVRVRNLLDTTTAPGRAHWHVYALLSGPYTNLNGIASQGAISLEDVRLNHVMLCMKVGADSIGQRLISPIAVADTTTEQLTLHNTAKAIIEEWYAGDHDLPSGWMAIVIPPVDAWISDQFDNGHGLTREDPIKWGLDWTDRGTPQFYERTDASTECGAV